MKKKKVIKKHRKARNKLNRKLPKRKKKLLPKKMPRVTLKKVLIQPVAVLPTLLEQITEDFKIQVLQNRSIKIKKDSILSDFCSDQRFKKEFKDMFLERSNAFFGVSIRHLYENNLNEVLQFLRDHKMKKIKFNWK